MSRATVPKEELPEHIHNEAQVILAIDSGYLSRALGSDIGTGFDLVYNPPGTVHRDCFWGVGGRFLSVTIPQVLAPRGHEPCALRSNRAMRSARALLGKCVSGTDPLGIEESILNVLAAVEARDEEIHGAEWLGIADEMIAVEATEAHVTIAGLARKLGLHPVYFARAYRAARGHGPAKTLQAHRIAAAVAMLSRDRSLAEVALSCGFADQSHLCRAMRSWIGVPPKALRAAFEPS